jgi:hypothetical protein
VVIDWIIIAGMVVNVVLNYVAMKRAEEVEDVLGQLLYDLGKQGVINVEIYEDD